MFHEQIFEVQGRAINAAVGPNHGPALLMLHGVTRRWQTFVPLLPALATRFEVFCFDYLGHGKSDRTNRGYRVADYVETMAELLSQPPFSTHKKLYLYGHSLGSMVATALAGRFAAKVQAVVLEDPPFQTMGRRIESTSLLSYFKGLSEFAGSTEPATQLAKRIADMRVLDPTTQQSTRLGDTRDAASLLFTAKSLTQLDPRVFEPIVNGTWLDGYDVEAVLSAVPCPTLLLQADWHAGGMLTNEDAHRATTLMKQASHIRLEGVGHLIHWLRTEQLLRYTQAFFESV